MNRPTSVTVLGILNIVFAAFGLMGIAFYIAMMFVPSGIKREKSGVGFDAAKSRVCNVYKYINGRGRRVYACAWFGRHRPAHAAALGTLALDSLRDICDYQRDGQRGDELLFFTCAAVRKTGRATARPGKSGAY